MADGRGVVSEDGPTFESEELSRVRRYREAARLAVRSEVKDRRRIYLALIDLAEAARHETDPLVRTWAERAVWEESKRFLGVEDEDEDVPDDPYIRRVRAMRAEGYARCPRCLADLPAEMTLRRWEREYAAHLQRLADHESAVR